MVDDSQFIEQLQSNKKRIAELVNEAERIRINLISFLSIPIPKISIAEDISTNENTEIASQTMTFIDSPSATNCDLNSPAASTIYLRSSIHPRRRQRERSLSEKRISPDLRKILHTVTSSAHRKALMAIERFGLDAVKYKRGFTALHWACKVGNQEVVKYLLGKGADISLRDDDGMSPQDYTDARGDMETSRLLDSHCMDKGHHLALLERLVDLKTLKESHKRALEAIATHGWSCVKWGGGWTILHWAFQHNREDVIDFCRRIDAPFDTRDENGNIPVYYAKN